MMSQRTRLHLLVLFCATVFIASPTAAEQQTFQRPPNATAYQTEPELFSDQYYTFPKPIRRVAVIGAGPGGLVHADALIKDGFEVRLFERAPQPGGQWYYTETTPLPASFPNLPINISAYTPDVPPRIPFTREYEDGDDGLSVSWRLREHGIPSSVWSSMTTTIPPVAMVLPEIAWPADTPWYMNRRHVGRYLRQYASSIGLHSNDEESAHITSYSTRVERAVKNQETGNWELLLRRMVPINLPGQPAKLKVDWWTEEFDAVVAAPALFHDAPYVPDVPGLHEWANAFPDCVIHSREYRRPDRFAGKSVLIVGGSFSATGIAIDLAPHTKYLAASVRHGADGPRKGLLTRFPKNATLVHEIVALSSFQPSTGMALRDAKIQLSNGQTIGGFDCIIFATGARHSYPFLPGFHNSSIVGLSDPEVEIAPIITDGTHRRSLHWTGHYIPDPTLAISTLFPWDHGPFQATGFARVWSGKARLPSIERMWAAYPGHGRTLMANPGMRELTQRLYLGWLNEEAIKFGGRLIAPVLREAYQPLNYWYHFLYGPGAFSLDAAQHQEEMPRSEWRMYNGDGESNPLSTMSDEEVLSVISPHWAEVVPTW
ncbi:FAD/NAD(P)-binding domain-containing protein [Clavulina sp. PMI_390]|nr:FAD/NAD(P)-binding domain-containing protein [Clavulina sp. PMI_390]